MNQAEIQKINLEAYANPAAVDHYEKKLKLRSDEEWIATHVFTKPKASILILGCGAGRTVIPLAQKGFQITALDIVPEMVAACRKNLENYSLSATVVVGDSSNLSPSFSKSFDYVFAPFHSFDYIAPIEHRYQAIAAAREALKPNGVFVFNTHNRCFFRYFQKFRHSPLKPYVKDAVPHAPGYVISFYASPYRELKNILNIFPETQFIWRGGIETKFPLLKKIIRRAAPLFFEKSIYYICTKTP